MLLSILSLLADANDKKNILIFFIDDLRPELGCYDVDYIKSPNIDRLSSQGVQFDRAYPRGKVMGYSLRTDRWRYTEWTHSESGKVMAKELYDHSETQLAPRNLAEDSGHEKLIATLAQQLNARQRAGKGSIKTEKAGE